MDFKQLSKVLKRKSRYLLYRCYPRLYATTYWIGKVLQNCEGDVIQIGSNDGKADDPIHPLILKSNWRVFFVEAVDYLLEKLKSNYPSHERFNFCNLAINDGSPSTFYFVDPQAAANVPNLPPHFDKLGSFLRSNITKHLGPYIEPYIREKHVSGQSLMDFFFKNGIEDLILIHTDTEGYDWVILKQLDLVVCTPKIILFEHKHLTHDEKKAARNKFIENYRMFVFGQDTLCVNRTMKGVFNVWDEYLLSKKEIVLH